MVRSKYLPQLLSIWTPTISLTVYIILTADVTSYIGLGPYMLKSFGVSIIAMMFLRVFFNVPDTYTEQFFKNVLVLLPMGILMWIRCAFLCWISITDIASFNIIAVVDIMHCMATAAFAAAFTQPGAKYLSGGLLSTALQMIKSTSRVKITHHYSPT